MLKSIDTSASEVSKAATDLPDPIGVRQYDYVEFFVGSARMVAYWYAKALGLDISAYAGPETGVRDRMSFYITKNDLKFVLTSGLHPSTYDVWGFITHHGDGVKRWAIEVDDVEKAFIYATTHGAMIAERPRLSNSEVYNIQKFISTPAKRFKTKFSKSEAVKITDGPFSDFLGSISDIDEEKGKVKVLVSIFGRETPVELDLLQIAKV